MSAVQSRPQASSSGEYARFHFGSQLRFSTEAGNPYFPLQQQLALAAFDFGSILNFS
jgi:hypothetical protein